MARDEIGKTLSRERPCWSVLESSLSSGPKGPKGNELVACFAKTNERQKNKQTNKNQKNSSLIPPFLLYLCPLPYQIPCSVSWRMQQEARDKQISIFDNPSMRIKLLAPLPTLQQGNVAETEIKLHRVLRRLRTLASFVGLV